MGIASKKERMQVYAKGLFDNLLTIDELRLEFMRGEYSKRAIYLWVSQGMPHRKIAGKLWFDPEKTSRWLEKHKEV